MQRTIKYGLTGAVLAGMIGATVAFSSNDRVIHLVVDGQQRTVTTEASTVAGVLRSAGYHLTARDLVAPAPSAAVHDGSRIVLQQARELHLDVDGKQTAVWTTAPTVAEALAQLGYSSADLVSVSRTTPPTHTPTHIALSTPRPGTDVHDGPHQHVTNTAPTVA
ncbi:MAG: ubiquitin-like domain-containing protein, partial [Jatrophihabitans sp.]|uniref:ubiquitin-like domain-containing protein n=1 Tax=Jatrophihabitans sp. TaxID=1932789 RepID=UPI003F7FD44C